jgi:hypothetical protein
VVALVVRRPVLGAADPAARRPLRSRRTALTPTTPHPSRTRSDLWEPPGPTGPSTTPRGEASGGSGTRRRPCWSSTRRHPRAAARSTSAAERVVSAGAVSHAGRVVLHEGGALRACRVAAIHGVPLSARLSD